MVFSSRKVIKIDYLKINNNSYYSEDIWGIVKNEIAHLIPKNYTLYGEILGYLHLAGQFKENMITVAK